MTALLVMLGAGLGGMTRHVAATVLDGRWPRGTLLVNVVGSGLLGLLAGVGVGPTAWALLAIGFCGGLTTFSSFAVQAVDRPRRRAAAYVAVTVAGALGTCALGWWLGTAVG